MTGWYRHWLIPAYFFLCLLLGGASAAGLWANALLQLLALPILLWAVTARDVQPLGQPGRQLLSIVGFGLLLFVIQLVPLPPNIWVAMPGRDHVHETFRLIGQPLPWLPISLSPYDTIASLLWLLPALALLLALLRRGVREPARLAWVIIAVMAVSVLVGAMQVTGQNDSFWYLYRITNYGVTVGFFANANHMATLLVVSLPFIAALYATARRKNRNAANHGPLFVILVSTLLLVAVGLVINGSLAGLGLMLPVAIASTLMLLDRSRLPRWTVPLLALVTAASVATVLSGWFDNNLIGAAASGGAESRQTSFRTTFQAAMDYFPFGSGIGTFASVYRMYEDPEQITTTYMNHAHSDYLEIFLETGLLGIFVVLLFVLWWARQTKLIWRSGETNPLARAATIASGAILAHSAVDYPLRTVAISAIFAVCCALMSSLTVRAGRSAPGTSNRAARHLTAD
jgi:O-antigen ligase